MHFLDHVFLGVHLRQVGPMWTFRERTASPCTARNHITRYSEGEVLSFSVILVSKQKVILLSYRQPYIYESSFTAFALFKGRGYEISALKSAQSSCLPVDLDRECIIQHDRKFKRKLKASDAAQNAPAVCGSSRSEDVVPHILHPPA